MFGLRKPTRDVEASGDQPKKEILPLLGLREQREGTVRAVTREEHLPGKKL